MLGQRIKKIREIRGLTQSEAAASLEISLSTYKNWEQDKNDPNTAMVIKLSKLFRTTTDFLYGESDLYDSPEMVVGDRKWLYDRIGKASNEDIGRLRRIIGAIDDELDGNKTEDL